MPRKPTVTVEGTIKAIKHSDTPVVSTGALADYFDVTRQAIRDQRERISNDPRIDRGEIGNNTVFYISESHQPHKIDVDGNSTAYAHGQLPYGEYECPECNGAFPEPVENRCPWCENEFEFANGGKK